MRVKRPNTLAFLAIALLLAATASCKGEKQRREVGGGEPTNGSSASSSNSKNDNSILESAPPAKPKGRSGTLVGVVKLTGDAPEMPLINNGSDTICAQKKLRAETILVGANNTLTNALVRVKPGTVPAWTPETPIVVKQDACMYRPRIQGAVAGQDLIVYNRDETAHNVHVRAAKIGDRQGAEALWNRQQPKVSSGLPPIREKVKDHPVMRLKCDQHGWMSGYLVVSDNPFSTTSGDDGSFELDVPTGELTVEAWHEFYGLKEATVTIEEGKTARVEFTFDAVADNPTASKVQDKVAPAPPKPERGN